MGSCASVHGKNPDAVSPSSASMKFRVPYFSSSKSDKTSIPPTPIKEKPTTVEVVPEPPPMINVVGYKSQVSPFNSFTSFSNHGSREETFFDSQAWLDSDCESDFYSVNGDFTPSRGSTPVHGSVTPSVQRPFSPQLNKAFTEDRHQFNNGTARSRGSTPVHRNFSAASPLANGTTVYEGKSVGSSTNSSPSGRRKKLADLFKESTREQDIGNQEVTNPVAFDLPPRPTSTTPYISGKTSSKVGKAEAQKQPQCCLPRLVSRRSMTPPAIAVVA